MKAHSARSAVLGVAVVAALATGGLAYGSAAGHDANSTTGAQTAKAAPAGTKAGGTTSMVPKQGVQPSKTIPQGSTADARSLGTRAIAPKVRSTDVDKSDRGVKGARATKDRGTKNARVTKG